jgi:hypothetical protein
MKKCSKCGKIKDVSCFVKNKQCKDGYAGTCKECNNTYNRKWKQKNAVVLAEKRRKKYAETKGKEVKEREQKRKMLYPLRVRCQLLRSGMRDRAKRKGFEFDGDYFTVNYLMKRLEQNPCCECCGKTLDIKYKKDKKFNDSSPSMDRVNAKKGYTKENVAILCWECNKHKQDATSDQLRRIADFMDVWGNEVESDIDLAMLKEDK